MSARAWPFSLFDSKRGKQGTRGYGPNGMPWWIARPLTLHSPSAHVHGDCWCQNLGEPVDNPPVFPGVPRYDGFNGPALEETDTFANALVTAGGWCAPTNTFYNLLPTDEDFTPHSSDTEGITTVESLNEEMSPEGIAYDDAEKLKSVLVGKKIVGIRSNTDDAGSYSRVLSYELDNGTVLEALARDGGCACSNGCFSVDINEETKRKLIGATIMSVQVEESIQDYAESAPGAGDWAYRTSEVIVNGEGDSPTDGTSRISIFVYTDLASTMPVTGEDPGRLELVSSEGGDNGYYGWGFSLRVLRPSAPREGVEAGALS